MKFSLTNIWCVFKVQERKKTRSKTGREEGVKEISKKGNVQVLITDFYDGGFLGHRTWQGSFI